jgi:hypothetical protein
MPATRRGFSCPALLITGELHFLAPPVIVAGTMRAIPLTLTAKDQLCSRQQVLEGPIKRGTRPQGGRSPSTTAR